MPFKSKAQWKKFFAMESRGEIPKGTAERWAKETPSIKRLPARVKSKKAKAKKTKRSKRSKKFTHKKKRIYG